MFIFSVNCSPGYKFDNDTEKCIACPLGTFQPETGNETCRPCQANFTTSQNASTSESDCILRKYRNQQV